MKGTEIPLIKRYRSPPSSCVLTVLVWPPSPNPTSFNLLSTPYKWTYDWLTSLFQASSNSGAENLGYQHLGADIQKIGLRINLKVTETRDM